MKKSLFKALLLLLAISSFTACNESDNEPIYEYHEYSNGAYVVNAGNLSSQIAGSLTHIDFSDYSAVQNVFYKANGKSLGLTPNDGIVYGSKIYVAVDAENTIEVLDKKTMTEIAQIKTPELIGGEKGVEPRHIIGGNGAVYFTTYDGYVAAVDTTKFTLVGKWQVGAYPEGLIGIGNNIYVANSNKGKGNGTISVINIKNNDVQTKQVEGVENPQKFFFVNDALWVLDWGHYLSVAPWTQENAGLKKIVDGKVAQTIPATLADAVEDKFYIVNAPYGSGVTTYSYYDAKTLKSGDFDFTLDSPTAIAVDPVTGNIFVTSNKMGDYGYADYYSNGYVKIYNAAGKELHKLDVGVGACAIFFDAGVNIIKK